MNSLSSYNESPRKKEEDYFTNASKITNKNLVNKIGKIMKTTNTTSGSNVQMNKKTMKLKD